MKIRPAVSFALPRRFMRRSYGRLVLTIVALSAGVGLVCAMDLVTRAVVQAFDEVIDTMAGRAALDVTANGAPMPEDAGDTIAAVAGVESAIPIVNATTFVADGSGELLSVFGVDVTNDVAVRAYESHDDGGPILDDPLTFLNQPDSIVLTRTLAAERGLAVGDALDLLTPTGRRTFRVRGLLDPHGIARAYGGNLLIMDLPAAETAFLRPGFVNRIDVVVRRDARVEDVAAAIARAVPAGWRVEAPSQRKADLQQVMISLQVMLSAVSLVSLAAAFLIILNRLGTVFEIRAWQLGILRAVGMRARVLWWELLKESLLLAAVGVVLGIPLGIAAGRLLLPVVATTAALNFKLIATPAVLTVRLQSLGIAAVLGFGTAVLAAALPAWRIARRPPVETIRGRGVAPRAAHRTRWWLYAGVAVAGGVGVVAQYCTQAATWGLIGTLLIVIVAGLMARPLCEVLLPPLMIALRAVFGPNANIARATFAQNPGRAVVTVAMIGIGIGAIIWVRMLAYSFETSLVEALSGAMQGDWVVSSSRAAQGFLEAPLDERMLTELQGIDGIQAAIGERLVDWGYRGATVAIDAFDPSYFAAGRFGRLPLIGAVPDAWSALASGTGILVSGSLGVAPGDMMAIQTPRGPLSVRVAGMTVDFGSPGGTVVMSRDLYRTYWNDPQINRAFVRLAPGAGSSTVRSAIAASLGERYGLRVISARDLMDYFATQVRRAFAPIDVLAALLLLVLLLGLADTLAAGVLERTHELAIIRTLGAKRRGLRRAVLAEGIGLAVPGLLLAVVTGLVLGTMWVRQTFPLLLGWPLEVHIPTAQIVVLCAATLAVCWASGIFPARRAAAVDPVEALRWE